MVTKKQELAIIIMAAGLSSRFKVGNKLLYQIKGESLLEITLKNITSYSPTNLFIITGNNRKEISTIAKKFNINEIFCENWGKGLSESLKQGIKNVKNYEALIISHGDMPFIDKNYLKKIVEQHKIHGNCIITSFNKYKGLPALLTHSVYNETIKKLKGDKGAKEILLSFPNLEYINATQKQILDIDLFEQLALLNT